MKKKKPAEMKTHGTRLNPFPLHLPKDFRLERPVRCIAPPRGEICHSRSIMANPYC